jgi:predicted dehydrogenase
MTTIRMAQYGTKHGHAEGKLLAMQSHPRVEVAGVYEPDPARRAALEGSDGVFGRVRWFDHPSEMLGDPSIIAVASEGLNSESLAHTEQIVRAGKHAWYDKPAGEDWPRWQGVMTLAAEQGLHVQMGYMFRYHHGFRQIAEWVKGGLLGEVFSVRAHMSTSLTSEAREVISVHPGGIFYDLAGHMLDQIVWLLGWPERVTAFLRNDSGVVPAFKDNTLGVFEFERAIAFIDIAAMEARPMARRFEVYGDRGSAILIEPFEPAHALRLCLEQPGGGFERGVHIVPVAAQTRQALYDLELDAFIATINRERPPDRSAEHELLVQEMLLRAVNEVDV